MTDDWRDEASGGFVSMIPVFGPLLADPARRLSKAIRDEHARVQSRALRAAEVTSGLSREELAERIARTPQLVPIVTKVLFAAGMTGCDETLDALGAALGLAAAEPDRTDAVELVLVGLADLRSEHIQVLRVMQGGPRWLEPPEETADLQSARIISSVQSETWNVEALAELSGLDIDTAYVAATGLCNAGFARAYNALGGMGYRMTALGDVLLEVLARHDDSSR